MNHGANVWVEHNVFDFNRHASGFVADKALAQRFRLAVADDDDLAASRRAQAWRTDRRRLRRLGRPLALIEL